MAELLKVILYSLISGITILIGAIIANAIKSKDKKRLVNEATAFGGGILISAVAFALTPRAIQILSLSWLIIIFVLGTLTFFFIDRFIESRGGSIAQVMAMLMDFIPEALALGAAFAHDVKLGLLLAFFIGLQNLPEGFNAFQELISRGFTKLKTFMILTPLSFIGVIAAIVGNLFFSESPKIIAAIMLFAGGGITYLMFHDIAPIPERGKFWTPALSASLGFLLGMICEKLLF